MKQSFNLNLDLKEIGSYAKDLNRYAETINVLPPQVKIIILIVVMGVLFNIWNAMFWSPLQKKKMETTSKTIALTEEILSVRRSIVVLQKDLSAKVAANVAQNLAQGAKQDKQQAGATAASQVSTVADMQMYNMQTYNQALQKISQVLGRLLIAKNNLRMISLQTIESKDSIDPITKQKCFEHTLAIKFRGDYFATLAYMKDIAKLNWSIYWDSLNYSVTKYPEAEVTLQIRALSF